MALYQLIDGGKVMNTVTKQIIPNDSGNFHWREYEEWVALGNTPDPIPPMTLAAAKAVAYNKISGEANREFMKHLKDADGLSATMIQRMVREAFDAGTDGTPTAAKYPLLEGLRVDGQYASIAAAATGVNAWWDTRKVLVAPIEAKRWKAFKDIEAAESLSEVTTASTVTWPV